MAEGNKSELEIAEAENKELWRTLWTEVHEQVVQQVGLSIKKMQENTRINLRDITRINAVVDSWADSIVYTKAQQREWEAWANHLVITLDYALANEDTAINPGSIPMPPAEPLGLWKCAMKAARSSDKYERLAGTSTAAYLAWGRTIRALLFALNKPKR